MSVDKVLGIVCCGCGIALGLTSVFTDLGWGWAIPAVALFLYGWYLLRRSARDGADWVDAVDVIGDGIDLLD